jgi:hypothetical protein
MLDSNFVSYPLRATKPSSAVSHCSVRLKFSRPVRAKIAVSTISALSDLIGLRAKICLLRRIW